MDVYFEDINITNENGFYRLAMNKKVYPPEKDYLNWYYLITSNQAIAANDIIFELTKEEYDKIIESNFDEEYISSIMNKHMNHHYVIHKPKNELDEMLNDDQKEEEKENSFTK